MIYGRGGRIDTRALRREVRGDADVDAATADTDPGRAGDGPTSEIIGVADRRVRHIVDTSSVGVPAAGWIDALFVEVGVVDVYVGVAGVVG